MRLLIIVGASACLWAALATVLILTLAQVRA